MDTAPVLIAMTARVGKREIARWMCQYDLGCGGRERDWRMRVVTLVHDEKVLIYNQAMNNRGFRVIGKADSDEWIITIDPAKERQARDWLRGWIRQDSSSRK